MRVLIAGGGTGGHFYPALAMIEQFQKYGSEVKVGYIGTKRGIEARVLPSYRQISFFPIHVQGLERGNAFQNLGALILLVISFLQTGIVLLLFRPHVVIGMGGYASFPPVFLASILGKILPISTLIHEQNALAGLTNRLLARFVDKVLISYPQTKAQFSSARNVITTGNPVRNEFFVARRTPAVYKSFGLLQDKKTVLVFGGSNGSSALTNAVRKNKEQIARDKDIQVLLVTGKLADTSMIELELAAAGVTNIVCKTYIKRMGDAFAVADLVVSRAGASTLAEITSCGKPSILIPLGKSADGHQLANARVLGDKRGCAVIEEDNFLDRRLAQLIEQMIRDKQRLSLMAERSMCMGNRNAAASMLGEVVAVVEGGRT